MDTARAACMVCPIGTASAVDRRSACPMTAGRRRTAGTYLFVAGERAESLFYISSGAVSLARATSDQRGEGTPYAIRRAGSLLGVEGLVRDTYRDTARAVTAVTLCAAPRAGMSAWLEREGAARTLLDCVLSAWCGDDPRRTTTDGNAVQRVAEWLLDDAERWSARSLPRSVLAGLLGMKPETLSRAIATLAKRGAVTASRARVEVVDRDLLRAIADGG